MSDSHTNVGKVVEGLKGQPIMLALVVLNVIGISAAVWFLSALLTQSNERMLILMKNCLPPDLR